MPKRPRQHIIEDASRLAFEGVLPRGWVYRPLSHDYGIDGEVEIFDEGSARGLMFKVQLKGTEAIGMPVVRLSNDKSAYYASLSEPVLVVLHHGPSERVFARWFQSYDPQVEPPGKAGIALHFRDEHELSAATSYRLRADVETHWRLRDSRRTLPMNLALGRTSSRVAGTSTAAVVLALREVVVGYGDIVTLDAAASGTEMGTIEFRNDGVAISCRGIASATIHYEESAAASVELLVHDTLVLLADLLERFGQSAAAARLFIAFARGSRVARDPDAIRRAVRSLIRTRKFSEAIALSEDLAAGDMSVTWRALSYGLSSEDHQAVLDYLLHRVNEAESTGDRRKTGIAHYNVANKLRELGRQDEALRHYRQAAELDSTYAERDYFAGETAGCLFETGDFNGAAEMYLKALEGGKRERYLPLLADALLMSGQYRRAQETFNEVVADRTNDDTPSEWRLKLRILDRLLNLGWLATPQLRDPEKAMALADVAAPDLTEKQRRQQLEQALRTDALCPLAWFNLGLLESNVGHLRDAFEAFAAAGMLSRYDLEAFVRSLIVGVVLGEPATIDVVRVTYLLHGSRFIHFLVDDVLVTDSAAQDALLEFVEEVLDEDAARRSDGESVELRFVDEHGAYESMQIRPDVPDHQRSAEVEDP